MILSIACLMVSWASFISPSWAQTYVSGKVFTSDGMVAASGAVALAKGEFHNNAFLAGGAIGSEGSFKIPLPSGGPWGLHVYSEKYIYFPLQIQITAGADNDIPVILPVDGTAADDPKISDIQFKKLSDQVFQIAMQVDDPNNNLGPQMLAIDTKRFKSYRLAPKGGDLKDMKADFPNGEYISPFIPVALDGEDLKDWLLVVADHQCSKGNAELKLHCQENEVLLKGTFQYPDRSGDWVFAKLKNAKAALSGEKLFAANCSACHYPDRKDKKVGPGLMGLFKSAKLPDSGLPVTDGNVRERIVNGGDKMPPFKHLKEEELKAIVDYLKSL